MSRPASLTFDSSERFRLTVPLYTFIVRQLIVHIAIVYALRARNEQI